MTVLRFIGPFLLFSALAWGQCAKLVYNPITNVLDCIGSASGGGTIGGSIATGQIAYGSGANTITGSAGFTFTDAANVRLATLAGSSSQSTNALLDITNSAGSNHWLTVLGDGKVGIGTNAPSQALSVSGYINIIGTNLLTFGSTGTVALNSSATSNGDLRIYSGGIQRITAINAGSVGIGTSNTTPANATLSILDATPASGATATWVGHDGSGTYSGVHLSALTTSLKVVAGLTQGSTPLLEFKDAGGTQTFVRVSASQTLDISQISGWSGNNVGAAGNERIRLDSDVGMALGGAVKFNSTANYGSSTPDTSLSRCTSTAGCVAVGTGAAGSVAGKVKLTEVIWVTGTESTCDSSNRGRVVMTQGSTGVADTFRVCVKTSADSYVWTALF